MSAYCCIKLDLLFNITSHTGLQLWRS